MRQILVTSFVSLLFIGCTTHQADPKITMQAPTYVDQTPSRVSDAPQSNEGSLFGQGDNPLFSDLKAMHVNDIVTVTISENIAQSSQAKKSLSKNSQDSLGGGVVTNGSSNGALKSVTNAINSVSNIGFQSGSTDSFTGSGSNTRDEKFATTISARIIKILNNGNYFIEGSRELLLNGEKQIIQISGVIRPYDIDQTNTIDSKYIADAKILYKTQGDMDKSTSKPWGTKLIESVWPF
ncbi:MAG: flagellar basal body L-ring protein FlgH [Sulfurospirillaceae bacterium]|nr:flagellar basal body L-ring protein FlgH [Sulfurospirillaceae bacterium]